jgi:hypothetical protein
MAIMPENCSISPLADDILPSVADMAEYIYGRKDKAALRRVRHMIEVGSVPTKKVAGRHESRKSWINAAYAQPDRLKANTNGKG